jgi:SAM-dependent methyltransferase
VDVIPVRADFMQPFELPGGGDGTFDGMLFANALHFAPEPERVLARLARWLRPGGRVVVVEYDRRPASRWVPFPIPAERFPSLAGSAGLSRPFIVATRPSAFGGDLYVAVADRPEDGSRARG